MFECHFIVCLFCTFTLEVGKSTLSCLIAEMCHIYKLALPHTVSINHSTDSAAFFLHATQTLGLLINGLINFIALLTAEPSLLHTANMH